MHQQLDGIRHFTAVAQIGVKDSAETKNRLRFLVQEPAHQINLVDADLAGEAERKLLVQAPVHQLVAFRRGSRAPPALAHVPLRTRHDGIAQRTGAHKIAHEMFARVSAHLQAGLEIQLHCFARRNCDCARVLDSVSQRRFAIHVLARLERREHDVFMEMRRRGDDDALNFLHRQHLLIILEGLRFRREFAGTAKGGFVIVANGEQRSVRQ